MVWCGPGVSRATPAHLGAGTAVLGRVAGKVSIYLPLATLSILKEDSETNMVQIKINTPKVQSEEALGRLQQVFHYMERGILRHGVMVPMGVDVGQMKAGDQLWQLWTDEERQYLRGVRNIFAHARYRVLGNGALSVRDRSPRCPGKPDLDGLHFDETVTDWEWNAQQFLEYTQRLETLVLQHFQGYFQTTVTCQVCGQSVDGRDRLTCGHVRYGEAPKGSILNKPAGGTVQVKGSIGYHDDIANEQEPKAIRGIITDEGLDKILRSWSGWTTSHLKH